MKASSSVSDALAEDGKCAPGKCNTPAILGVVVVVLVVVYGTDGCVRGVIKMKEAGYKKHLEHTTMQTAIDGRRDRTQLDSCGAPFFRSAPLQLRRIGRAERVIQLTITVPYI